MSAETVLYDLPAKDGRPWSPNPWKSRMLLNFKGIPYRTEWVEFPDIPAVVQPFGVAPNTEGFFPYTIPVVHFNDKYIMDSQNIAEAIEAAHPDPPLQVSDPLLPRVQALLGELMQGTFQIWMPQVPDALLNPKSYEYFVDNRTKLMGRPLLDVKKEYLEGTAPWVAEQWQTVRVVMEQVAALLREDKSGPFLKGKQPIYADFVLVTAIYFWKRIDEEGLYKRMISYGKELEDLYVACQPWFQNEA